MKFSIPFYPLVIAIAFTGCASSVLPPEVGEHRAAVMHLKEAGKITTPAEQRAALYLSAAKEANGLLDSKTSGAEAAKIYNKSAAGLTELLREANNGRMWNRPLTLTSGATTYHLRFASGTSDGIWDPAYFTSFKAAEGVDLKTIKQRNLQSGIGGALVGVHKGSPLEKFSPGIGITAPVTATLEFKGNDATLTLIDPSEKSKAKVAGSERSLNADFSAPLAYYPQKSELWTGLMGAIRVSKYMSTTGLYMLQPYDPDRIPLIFVHGLISTPQMWRNVINEIETDPTLRGRYQYWAFGYPTGNPPLYSALRFREELEKVHQRYPASKNYVLVGHSMGGLVSQMQVTDFTRDSWNAIGTQKAARMFKGIRKGSIVERATIFNSNPKVDRVVFICTPHRGSELAIGSVGELGMRLISLPVDLTANLTTSVGSSLSVMTGGSNRMPNSVSGLSPANPTLKVLDACTIHAQTHTIAGDRGKGDTPASSDGVVQYWSSRLKTAKSECIVPGPHGACEMPETLNEVRRILHLHLKENSASHP